MLHVLIQIAIQVYIVFGGISEEVTPVPFSNTEVKLFSADGTARVAVWESRTPPNLFKKPGIFIGSGFFCLETLSILYHLRIVVLFT